MKVLQSRGLIDALEESSKRGPFSLPYSWVKPAVFAVDVLVVALTGLAVGAVDGYLTGGAHTEAVTIAYISVLIQLYAGMMLLARGSYEPARLAEFTFQRREISTFWLAGFSVWLVGLLVLGLHEARHLQAIGALGVAGVAILIVWRYLVAGYVNWAMAAGGFAERRVVVLGEQDLISSVGILSSLRRVGYRPVQVVALAESALDDLDGADQVHAAVETMLAAARDHDSRIDEFVLVFGVGRAKQIQRIVAALKVMSIPVRLIPDQFTSALLERSKVRVGGIWSAELHRGPLTATDIAVKYVLDVMIAVSALILLSPLLLIVAVLIKIESRGPILFRQTRNGFNGRAFRIYKFRSMTVLEDGPVIRQATRDDRRVTRIGRWLRKTSIDEVPQLFNVLRGDMSIVGPRPHAVAHNTEYERLIAQYAFRHHVKPGITGWAQVNGLRGETSTLDHMAKRVELDLWYIRHWSHVLDIKVVLRTVILLANPNAY